VIIPDVFLRSFCQTSAYHGAKLMKDFPIIDLHCHLEGSINPEISYEILHRIGYPPANTRKEFFRKVRDFTPDWASFSEAVSLLDKCLIDRPSVTRVVSDIIERAVQKNVKILELSFAPREFQLQKPRTGNVDPFFEAVLDGVEAGSSGKEIAVGLKLLILPRHLSDEFRKAYGDVGDIIKKYRPHLIGADICTLDPIGEIGHSIGSVRRICNFVKDIGLRLSAHAGEFNDGRSIAQAITLGVDRIGHGIRIVGEKNLIEIVKENSIALEICPISNYRTGAIPEHEKHPLRKMLHLGMKVTINSDDQGVQNSGWRDDYELAKWEIGLTENEIRQCLKYSYEASFLDDKVKDKYGKYFTSP
jgi:adenosine deaminase